MKLKKNIKTLRLSPEEDERIHAFLNEHPFIRSFSTLVRASLWEFMKKSAQPSSSKSKPLFLWDYDLNEGEIREILQGPQKNRLWLVAKILEHARWDEIWEYLSLEQIRHDLPYLKLQPKTLRHWEDAIRQWKKPA